MYEFCVLRPGEVHANWPELRELLGRAVAQGKGEMEVDDILTLVDERRMYVCVLREAGKIALAIAAEIATYPRKKVLNVAYVGGGSGAVMAKQFYRALEETGRVFGVSEVRCSCRPSVARYLQRLFPDVKCAYMVMQREVAQ